MAYPGDRTVHTHAPEPEKGFGDQVRIDANTLGADYLGTYLGELAALTAVTVVAKDGSSIAPAQRQPLHRLHRHTGAFVKNSKRHERRLTVLVPRSTHRWRREHR